MEQPAQDNALDKFEYLSHLVRRLSHAQCAEYGDRLRELGFDPRRGQGRILKALLAQDGLTQKEIARQLGISPQSIGESLAKLEESGLVTRSHGLFDKRALIVELTETGKSLAQEIAELYHKTHMDVFGCLSEEECQLLSELLDKAIDAVEPQAAHLPDQPPHINAGPRARSSVGKVSHSA